MSLPTGGFRRFRHRRAALPAKEVDKLSELGLQSRLFTRGVFFGGLLLSGGRSGLLCRL